MSGRDDHVDSPVVESDLLGCNRAYCVKDDEGVGRVGLDELGDVCGGREDTGGCVNWLISGDQSSVSFVRTMGDGHDLELLRLELLDDLVVTTVSICTCGQCHFYTHDGIPPTSAVSLVTFAPYVSRLGVSGLFSP